MATKSIPWSRRRKILEADHKSLIRIYSYQHPDSLIKAQEVGWFSGNHDFKEFTSHEKETNSGFYCAYNFIKENMEREVNGFSGDYPVWAWLKRPTAKKRFHRRRPDIRITALVPRQRLLLSDFELFHCVLNGEACAFSEEEWHSKDSKITWPRIFDLEPRVGHDKAYIGQPDVIQACVDRIYLSEIVNIRYF